MSASNILKVTAIGIATIIASASASFATQYGTNTKLTRPESAKSDAGSIHSKTDRVAILNKQKSPHKHTAPKKAMKKIKKS
jgi:hypothetical protein